MDYIKEFESNIVKELEELRQQKDKNFPLMPIPIYLKQFDFYVNSLKGTNVRLDVDRQFHLIKERGIVEEHYRILFQLLKTKI